MATFIGRALGLEPIIPPGRTTAGERMTADVLSLVAFGPRVAGTIAEQQAAAWIEEAFTSINGFAATEDVSLPSGLTSRNVWTTVGAGAVEVLIGGHYDSVIGSPGADDNASGLAVILELARILAADPLDDLTVTLVGFGAEEVLAGFPADDHHFGSRVMAARLAADNELPDFMVSVDMVGLGDDLWAVTYLDQLTATADLLVEAGGDAGVAVTRMSRGDISDHEAFATQGVPAAFLWRPDNPNWHTPDDTTVVVEALEEDLAVMVAWLEAVRAVTTVPSGAS